MPAHRPRRPTAPWGCPIRATQRPARQLAASAGPIDTAQQATLGRRHDELAVTRADREIEQGCGGADLPASAITADHQSAAGGIKPVDIAVAHFEDVEVDLAEQGGGLPCAAGVSAFDQPEQRRPAGLAQLLLTEVWVAAADEVVGADYGEAHGVLVAVSHSAGSTVPDDEQAGVGRGVQGAVPRVDPMAVDLDDHGVVGDRRGAGPGFAAAGSGQRDQQRHPDC
jgi:hypothetical protein